jgi:glutathione S-transferase
MWTLRSSSSSPFARKIRIGAALCGLSDRMKIEPADTYDPADSLLQQNPLGKIPALVIDDGRVLYDSRVILEWLDEQAGGGKIIPKGPARYDALVMQALADGIMDANVLQVAEKRVRPQELQYQPWLDRQEGKVQRALNMLNDNPPKISGAPHVGHISLACALGQRDFRFGGTWRESYPRLIEFLDAFAAAVPAFEHTKPS